MKIGAAIFGLILVAALGLLTIGLLPVHSSNGPILTENFNNNAFDPQYWHTMQLGNGPSVTVANHRLEITIPSTSTNDPILGVFAAGLSSNCALKGDFDMQVRFQLLVWPSANGVRVGTGSNLLQVERISFGLPNDARDQPREVYLTHLQDGPLGVTPTADLQGTLRIVRTGNTATGYHSTGSTWTLIHTGPVDSADVNFGFSSWSHDLYFAKQNVKVAFDNFTLTSGQLLCPQISLTPTSGPVGTKVSVHGSGFPTLSTSFASIPSVEVTFDDMFLGTTTNKAGSIDFVFDVPDAQIGPHLVKTIDFLTNTTAIATFQVTPEATSHTQNISLELAVGTLYFPGDKASITGLTAIEGTPANPAGTTIQMTLYTPGNKSIDLKVQWTGAGLFKASYSIPATASQGTYTVIAKIHSPNNGNISALGSFEVKQSWLAQNSQSITIGTVASLGVLGTALVVWRKGKNKAPTLF